MAIQFKCPSCNHEIVVKYLNIGDEFMCTHCKLRGIIPAEGKPVTSYSEGEKPQRDIISKTNETVTFYNESEKANNTSEGYKTNVRFPAVKALSSIITVLAWILFAVSMIMGLMAFSNGGFLVGLPFIVGGVLVLIINLAIAQLLLLFMAIEENTRK